MRKVLSTGQLKCQHVHVQVQCMHCCWSFHLQPVKKVNKQVALQDTSKDWNGLADILELSMPIAYACASPLK
eukprot:119814-Pelagomonas_calceolata.AAC.2